MVQIHGQARESLCWHEWLEAHHIPHPRSGHGDYRPKQSCSEHVGLELLSKHEAVCSAWCTHRAVQGLAEWRLSLTLAGPPIGHHSVALFRACTLVAPGHVDTAEGAENASALCTLVDVCQRESAGKPRPFTGTAGNPRGPFTREDKKALNGGCELLRAT